MSPEGVPVYENVSVPPTMTFFTITVACFVFVKVQVTISPAATLKLAVRVRDAAGRVRVVAATDVSAQPAFAASTDEYVPGATLAEIVPVVRVEIEPEGVPVYANVSVPPTITFLTMTWPCLRFVKVQVTVSPASTLKVACRFASEPVEFGVVTAQRVRSQPAFAASVERY